MEDFKLKFNKLKLKKFDLDFKNSFLKYSSSKLSFYVFGQISYINLKKKVKFNKKNNSHINYLKKNILKFDNYKKLEGTFCFVIFFNKDCYIITDNNKSYEIFYSNNLKNLWISSKNLIKNYEYTPKFFNQYSLINILNVYGNYPLKGDTVLNEVSRLKISEYIQINLNKPKLNIKKLNEKTVNIQNDIKLGDYKKSLFESIKLTSSNSMNWIMMSSGWDSSSILAILIKFNSRKKITAVIGRVKMSDKYGYINDYEVQKAKKLCSHYKVKLKVINIDYNSKEYLKKIKFFKKIMKSNELYSLLSYTPFCLSEYISKKIKKNDEIVFSGDISDGAHNFGFSQYASFLNHTDLNFREYFDKIHTYFYSPSFFKKIKNGSFKDDYLFNLVKELKKIDMLNVSKKDQIKYYLMPLFLSQNRFPYENFLNFKYINTKIKKNYIKKVYDVYFKRSVTLLNYNNIYSIIIKLYDSFHWQSTPIRCMINGPRFFNINSFAPFRDQNVLQFLSKMPENWGRGLELRPTKYPLKKVLEDKSLNYPFNLQLGPHSYLYDTNPNWNPKFDLLYFSKASSIYKDNLRKLEIRKIFDKKFFNIKNLEKLKINYLKNKKETGKNLETIFNLISLSIVIQD
jgi:hypothetical protein